mgnify:CR=1 FL=1
MQPYTPHGDSNLAFNWLNLGKQRCNLIPLTGTVTPPPPCSRTLPT